VAHDTETRTQGGGSFIYYDRKKLVMRAALTFPVCALLAWVLAANMHRSPLVSLLVLAALGFYLWRAAALLFRGAGDDLTAISLDNCQVRLRTLTSSRHVPWQSVESVKCMRRVLRLWGLIPVSTTYELVFQLRHNGSFRKVKIPAGMLTIRPEAAYNLLGVALRHAQLRNNDAGPGERPDSISRNMAAQPDLSPSRFSKAFGRAGAERTRSSGVNDQATITPAVFGRKVP
jgi:hypothetical protein